MFVPTMMPQWNMNPMQSTPTSSRESSQDFQELLQRKQTPKEENPSPEKQEDPKSKEPQETQEQEGIAKPAQTQEETSTAPEELPEEHPLAQSLLASLFVANPVLVQTVQAPSTEVATPQTPLQWNTQTQGRNIQTLDVQQLAPVDPSTQTQLLGKATPQPQQGEVFAQTMQTQTQAQAQTQAQTQATVEMSLTQNATGTQSQIQESPVLAEGEDEVSVLLQQSASKPVFAQTEHMPVKVGQTPVLQSNQPDFPQQLTQHIQSASQTGQDTLILQLTPAHLGQVTVAMTHSENGTLQIVLHTSNETAQNLLREHAGELGSLLRQSNQTPVSVEVPQAQTDAFREQQEQQKGQGQNQQQQQAEQEQEDFLDQLRLGLIPETPEDSPA